MTTLALVGNPNSGKTTLFNTLTGSNQHVGNWPGVTVERKEGQLKQDRTFIIQDLPGSYSLSPYSTEEVVTRDFLINNQPRKILDVVDSTNLERNLYLTLQVMETGIPLVLIINMMDLLAKQKNRTINLKKLAYMLDVPVVGISALKHSNIDKLVSKIRDETPNYTMPSYDPRLESAIEMIKQKIDGRVATDRLRWFAIKIFERDTDITAEFKFSASETKDIENIIKTAENIFDDESDSIVVNARYDYIARIVNMCVIDNGDFSMSVSDKIDRIVTNRWLALPIFVLVMWVVYYLSIQTIGTIGSDWVNDNLFGTWIPNTTTHLLNSWNVAPWLEGLIVDGVISGVGSVLGFLPQIAMLFLCLGILEDCGYMSRIAFVMDRLFHHFNLSGKSFIPMLIATGCGVPGIMATRTIENDKDRRMTIMLTTFMPCSAKLTIIAMVSGTFFPHNTWVAPSAYFLGALAVVCSGIFLKKTKMFSGDHSPFVMELPAYHFPRLDNTLRGVWLRAYSFIYKAGTIIFLSCVLIWFLSSFNFKMQMVSQNQSILKALGSFIAPIFAPLGFGDWHATVAVLAGLIAKENCVGTFHITFMAGAGGASFTDVLRANYSAMAGYAFLAFNLLCAPCFASISTMYKEFGDARSTWRAVIYQTSVAYMVALVIYQSSQWIHHVFSPVGVALAAITIVLIFYGLFVKHAQSDNEAVVSL